jgi:hypothetical protein
MTSEQWFQDEDLLKELGAALKAPEPVEESLLRAARGAFAWRLVDEELALASITFDSLLDAAGVLRDGPAAPRVLAFEGADMGVEVEVVGDEMVGQIHPPSPGQVSVLTPEGTVGEVEADELGCFVLAPVPRGPVRLRCITGSAVIATDWVRL